MHEGCVSKEEADRIGPVLSRNYDLPYDGFQCSLRAVDKGWMCFTDSITKTSFTVPAEDQFVECLQKARARFGYHRRVYAGQA